MRGIFDIEKTQTESYSGYGCLWHGKFYFESDYRGVKKQLTLENAVVMLNVRARVDVCVFSCAATVKIMIRTLNNKEQLVATQANHSYTKKSDQHIVAA